MAVRTANVVARVEPGVKSEAESIISELGLSVSAVINSLYKQIIIHKGIPYSLSLQTAPKAIDEMSREEFDLMMETSLNQAKNGESIPAEQVFAEILNR
ncbi:MAG: type II toxin-antitoxin system RelB/DinJ family antitoxin [Oscillospiraceae bacterium]|nr:type II toxin-antitoxin system RelB/DinJ family antitoxin [Ruminococcus sp.]MCD8344399.1 type II toxin-antitoxin system RelB/DinJ family antitoxin [Oscillospiraceae bacterium]